MVSVNGTFSPEAFRWRVVTIPISEAMSIGAVQSAWR